MTAVSLEAIKQGKICPYCEGPTVFTDSAVVYHGMIYWCKPCNAWVGVHKGTSKELGRLANKELREAKKVAHFYFDQVAKTDLIHKICPEKIKNVNPRRKAYLWLAKQLVIAEKDCH